MCTSRFRSAVAGVLPGVVVAVAVACALVACTAMVTDAPSCADNQQCRAEFGVTAVCGDQGFCEYMPSNPRCALSYPNTLLSDPLAHRDTVVIGNLMDRSLATHAARENAVALALSQINAQGSFAGRDVGAVFCTIEASAMFDDLTREQAAVASARYLIDAYGVPAIIGPAASGDVQAVFEAISDRDVLMISPSATSPALSELEAPPFTDQDPGLLWRTAPPDSLQGQAMAADMTRPGQGRLAPITSVAVIHEQGAYGDGLTDVFEQAFVAAGGTVARISYQDASLLGESVAMAGSLDVEEVVFVSSQIGDVIAFLNAATLPSYDNKTIFLSDAAANSDVLTLADPARFDKVRGSRPKPLDAVADVVYASFLGSYLAAYETDAAQFSFTAHAYDAAWLVAYGAVWALAREGTLTGTNIARGLRHLSDLTAPVTEIRPSNWSLVVEAFEDGRSVNLAGASGPLDYDPTTEETSSDIEIWHIQNDRIIGVDTWPTP